MELMRVAGATLNQTPLDWRGNRQRIVAVLNEARAQGVELLCLPELCICGYSCEDTYLSIHTARRSEEVLAEILPATARLTVVLGLPHFFHGSMYNCAVMVQDQKILGVNAKRVLPREGVHYEQRWFRPWAFGKVSQTKLAGKVVPFGDIRYRLGSVGVAVEICEEAWAAVPASAHHVDAVELVPDILRLLPWFAHINDTVYQRENVKIQRRSLEIAEARFEGGAVTELDVQQAKALLTSTQSLIPRFESDIRQLNAQTSFLGVDSQEDVTYQNDVDFGKGDRVFLFTDGVNETKDQKKQEYGQDRLEDFIRKNHGLPVEIFNQNLVAELNAFRFGPYTDDVFILSMQIK